MAAGLYVLCVSSRQRRGVLTIEFNAVERLRKVQRDWKK